MSAFARASIFAAKFRNGFRPPQSYPAQKINQLQWKDGINLVKVPNLFGTCPNVQGEAPA
jgi:hypothetical protein